MILLFFLSRLFFLKIVFIPGPGSWRLTSSFHLLFFLLRQQDVKERERERRDVARKDSCMPLMWGLMVGAGLHN